MKQVSIFKAQPTLKSQVIEDVQININSTVPEAKDLQAAAFLYSQQGRILCDTLKMSLPGGTLDALLRCLLFIQCWFDGCC